MKIKKNLIKLYIYIIIIKFKIYIHISKININIYIYILKKKKKKKAIDNSKLSKAVLVHYCDELYGISKETTGVKTIVYYNVLKAIAGIACQINKKEVNTFDHTFFIFLFFFMK